MSDLDVEKRGRGACLDATIKEGESLFARGQINEAEKRFLMVFEKDPHSSQALNNLGVIAFQRQDLKHALDFLSNAIEISPFSKDVILNYAILMRQLNQLPAMRPLLEEVVRVFPGDPELSELLAEAKRSQCGKRIAFLCLPGFESFLKDIVAFVQREYETKSFISDRRVEIESAIDWGDVVWLEWANELAVAVTNQAALPEGKRIICRLHSYEAFSPFLERIRWENVHDLIFVAEHIKNIALSRLPHIQEKVKNIHVLPNGVDLQKLPFRDRPKGKSLAFLGYINYKKGPMLLIHAFRELVQHDPEYRLHIGGAFQDLRYELYFSQMILELNLQKNVIMEGWINDVTAWMEDKNFIICTSLLEGHPVGLLQGMACGLKPVIHNYVGAKGSYPREYLWNTIPEFVSRVTEDQYDPHSYRRFVEENYSVRHQLTKLERILRSDGQA